MATTNTIKEKIDALELQRQAMRQQLFENGVKMAEDADLLSMIDKMYTPGDYIPLTPPASMSDYAAIQRIVQAGKASEYFNLGDLIECKYTNSSVEYAYPFRVVQFESVTLEDGNTVPGMIVQAVYCTHDDVAFDTSNRNRWAVSSGRSWLQNTFKSRITPEFVDIIKPIKIETLRNYADSDTKSAGASGRIYDTTYDLFFPATTTNVGLQTNDNYNPTYGVRWGYWGVNNNNAARITRDVITTSTARYVWLRSAYRTSTISEYYVGASGSRTSGNANNTRRFAPACVIC